MTQLSQQMSWEGGVDLIGLTDPSLSQPNVIVHVARVVHTSLGAAPSGLVLWQPDPPAPPLLAGFISTDLALAGYYGPHLFADTPFESLPALQAEIEITERLPDWMGAKVSVAGCVLETRLSQLGPLTLVDRAPEAMPFHQQGLEAVAGKAEPWVNGEPVALLVPPTGPGRGPGTVWAPTGLYAR